MGLFSWRKQEGKLMLVFDIRSSSVGGALFWTQKNGIPKIIFTVREPIIPKETLDIDKFLTSTLSSLEIVVKKVYLAGLGKPDDIFCILSSPWHISQTRIIRFEKNTPFIFTAKLALDLIKKEVSLFEEENLEKYSDIKGRVKSIEFKNIKTVLNGYDTLNPLDQKTKELEMTIFVSMSPEQVLQKIEETIGKFFHFKDIKFSSFKLASFVVVRDVYSHNEDFILIDVDGEVTDISMIKKNVLRESISFPLGYNFLMRKLASVSHSSLAEAESLVSLIGDQHSTDALAKKHLPTLNKLKTDWLVNFQEALANLSNDISVPAVIYLTTKDKMADFFSEIIKNEQFNQYTLTESKFEIVFLGAEIFHGMAVIKDGLSRDSDLIIDAIFINRSSINPKISSQL